MTILDTVIEMQKKGMTDFEISKNLQSQGVSPREINDALNQAKVKNAVNSAQSTNQMDQQNQNQYTTIPPHPPVGPATEQQINEQPTDPIANLPPTNPATGPQPSIMQTNPQQEAYPQENIYPENQYAQPYPNGEQYADPYPNGEQYAGQEQYADPYANGEQYYGNENYGDSGYNDAETVTDIAEQVVNEKFKEYTQKTGDMITFKNAIEDKVAIIEQRLKRIEDNMDKLQNAIIQKIGEFGENSNMIRKDLENLHNTTSKLMNPLMDNLRELEKRK